MEGLLKWLKAGAKNKAVDLWGLVSRQAHLSACDRVQHEDTTAGPERSLQQHWSHTAVIQADADRHTAAQSSLMSLPLSCLPLHTAVIKVSVFVLCIISGRWTQCWSSTPHSHHPSGVFRSPPPAHWMTDLWIPFLVRVLSLAVPLGAHEPWQTLSQLRFEYRRTPNPRPSPLHTFCCRSFSLHSLVFLALSCNHGEGDCRPAPGRPPTLGRALGLQVGEEWTNAEPRTGMKIVTTHYFFVSLVCSACSTNSLYTPTFE